MSPKEYFAQMCKDAGLDEATTSALTAVADNEKLSPKLAALIKTANEDYPAQLGRVRAAEDKLKKYDEWYTTAKPIADQAVQRAAEIEAELARVRAGGDPPQFDASKYVSKEDLARFNADVAGRFAGVIKDTARIASRHAAKFGEELDLEAIDKLAQEQNLPISAAYDRWIQPRIEERQKKEFDEQLKKARDEGARDALSRHKLPIDPIPTDSAPVFAPRPKADAPAIDMDAELMNAWNSVGSSSR